MACVVIERIVVSILDAFVLDSVVGNVLADFLQGFVQLNDRLPTGTADDQLRTTKELVGTVKTPDGDLDILLTLVKRPGKPSIWLFATTTSSPASFQ